MPLTSPRFAGDARLQAASENNPPIKKGEPDREAVKKIQQGLRDFNDPFIGFMPLSFKTGGPDGKFGDETFIAVQKFQIKHKLLNKDGKPDGIVGRNTMGKLDALYPGAATVPVPPVPPAPPKAAVATVKIWMNSFIPKTVPGITKPVTAGPHAGSTFVLGPPTPKLGFPPTMVRGAFLTSNRGFDTSDTRAPAHCKMHSDITVDFKTPSPTVSPAFHVGGESVEIDAATGAVLRTALGSTARMVLTQVPDLVAGVPPGAVKLAVKMSQAIPLVFGASVLADMDIIGSLVIDPTARTVVFDGKVDEFPAYEAYVSVNGGTPLTLFRQSILSGKTPSDLIGLPTLIPAPGRVSF